jgi:hypothetical protein
VSDDPAATLGRRVEKLIGDAQDFRSFIRRAASYRPDAEWEIAGGRTVRSLDDSLRSIEADGLPPLARRGRKELRRLLDALIERWGWKDVVGPEGEAVLAKQARRLAHNRRTYHEAVRSHVEAFGDGQIDERPAQGYLDDAETAAEEGIPPAAPPVLREEDLETLRTAWIHASYLAQEFPTLQSDEFQRLDSAIQDLGPANHAGTPPEPAATEAHGATARDAYQKVPSVRALERKYLDGVHDDMEITAGKLYDLKIIGPWELRTDRRGRRSLWTEWLVKSEGLERRRRRPKSPPS